MKRVLTSPRPDYVGQVESLGFNFHSDYWTESAYFEFTSEEIDIIERDTNELYERCIEAAQYVIDRKLYSTFDIPQEFIPIIEESWDSDDLSIYGRFDFVFKDGRCHLLEFNADTPTSLFEASVVQWQWKEELFPSADQFNSLHERLIERFAHIRQLEGVNKMHFSCLYESLEDFTTTSYLQDLASQAGLESIMLNLSDIGWNGSCFTDPHEQDIKDIFKLYPWEWLVREDFSEALLARTTNWFEPPWKMLLSNKAILPILHRLFPDDARILPAFNEQPPLMRSYAKKPILSREGANVTLVRNGSEIASSSGEYGDGRFVWQDLCLEPCGGTYPIIGSWIVGGEASGIGIRESNSVITDNGSKFVPHIIV
ncbi:MAG: glutathionylspermidine synthase family protein [Bacteroidales bacterium]